jgi:peptide chain release factor 1
MEKSNLFIGLQKLEARYEELERLLATPEVIVNNSACNKAAKELSNIKEQVILFREYKKITQELHALEIVLTLKHEDDFLGLVREELVQLKNKKEGLLNTLSNLGRGVDKDLNKDIIVEIRPGTGGMEAALFAADLYRMYTKYAGNKKWVIESMSSTQTELGGLKEIVFSVKGKDAYKRLKFESGVHRVQRVPTTEAQGRIHTSTATVVVLVEPEEVEMIVEPKDLRIDTYRSSGPGGQHMQKTDSAVRITHIPTGVVVACQDERSQLKNKTKAMRVLGARIMDIKRQEEAKKVASQRKTQIGSGDRSEKIRTYNFPNRRITDHRINFTSHQLEAVLEGELDEISDALIKAAREKEDENK